MPQVKRPQPRPKWTQKKTDYVPQTAAQGYMNNRPRPVSTRTPQQGGSGNAWSGPPINPVTGAYTGVAQTPGNAPAGVCATQIGRAHV